MRELGTRRAVFGPTAVGLVDQPGWKGSLVFARHVSLTLVLLATFGTALGTAASAAAQAPTTAPCVASPAIFPSGGVIPANAPAILVLPDFSESVDMDDTLSVVPALDASIDAEGLLRFDYELPLGELEIAYTETLGGEDPCSGAEVRAELRVGPAAPLPERLGALTWSDAYPDDFAVEQEILLELFPGETDAPAHVMVYRAYVDGEIVPSDDATDPIAERTEGEWRGHANTRLRVDCPEAETGRYSYATAFNYHEVTVEARVVGTDHVVFESVSVSCASLVQGTVEYPYDCTGGYYGEDYVGGEFECGTAEDEGALPGCAAGGDPRGLSVFFLGLGLLLRRRW